jgi:hypothetical protein
MQSARLRPALDRLIAHMQGAATRPSRVGTRGQRETTKRVYVTPFGFDVGTSEILGANVKPADYAFLGAIINANEGESLETTTKAVIARPGFSAARVTTLLNQTYSVAPVTSDVTGLTYLKYNGDSRSCPFGRKAVDDDINDVFDLIKGVFLEQNESAAIKRCSLRPERLRY